MVPESGEMKSKRQLRRSPALTRDSRGAAMIELALVLPLLVIILIGTITAGIAYGRNNSIQNAARESSRYAATLPGPVNDAWLQSVRDVARAGALGDLSAGVPGQFICVAYVGGGNDRRMTDTNGVEVFTNGTGCFNDGRPSDEPRVQIVTSRQVRIEAVFFGWDVTLRSQAVARYERQE